MTSLDLYENFRLKLNRNDTNSNISVPKGKFVIVYNEQKNKWLRNKLKNSLNSYELDELNYLLVDDLKLTSVGKHLDHEDFTLPADFSDISSSFILASRNTCTRILDNWSVKDKNVRVLLADNNYKPSFDYEETLCSAVNGKLKVYKDDFEIEEVYLSYYREPGEIDIEGYIKADNTSSTNRNPDIPDHLAHEIIDRCVLEFQAVTENPQGFPIAKDRVNSQEK